MMAQTNACNMSVSVSAMSAASSNTTTRLPVSAISSGAEKPPDPAGRSGSPSDCSAWSARGATTTP
jgi:hypothetical protein